MAKTKRRIALSPQWQAGRQLDDVNVDMPELAPAVASLDTAILQQAKPTRVSRARKRAVADDVVKQDAPQPDRAQQDVLEQDVLVRDLLEQHLLEQDLLEQDLLPVDLPATDDELPKQYLLKQASKTAASKQSKAEAGPAAKAFRDLILSNSLSRSEPSADFSEPLTGDPQPPEWLQPVVAEQPAARAAPATQTAPVAVPPSAVASRAVAVPKHRGRSGSDLLAYLAAVALAGVAGFFSVSGMAEIFPGAPLEVMTLAATMEGGKLIIVGWLAAHWRESGVRLRAMLTLLVLGLALINGIGVFGKLVEAHVGAVAGVQAQVAGKLETMDVRINAQAATVADLDRRIAQIDGAIDEATRRGRVNAAMALSEQKRRDREALAQQRGREVAALTDLRTQRAALGGERAHAEAAAGPVRYLATLAGTDTETAVRWLILLMVACCDPAAIGLTIAAAGRKTAAA